MNLISIDSISKTIAEKKLFSDISFGINQGQKIALIGVNGSGKTTLLNIIAGFKKADKGNVAKNKECRINFLSQIPKFSSEHSILDHIFNSDSNLINLIKNYEYLCATPANTNIYQKKLDDVMAEMNRLDAWHYESEIKSILGELGINDINLKMGELSGGMLKKVSLAQALIDEGNLLILDEPTNHLDVDTVTWLQAYLKKTNQSIIMVTHDRYFLDEICNTIIEIDMGTLFTFNGNYSYYLEKKSEMEEQLLRDEARITNILRNELKWLKRGAKARSTKQKARIDRIHNMQDREQYKEKENIELEVSGRRLGNRILEVSNISKSYNSNKVINPFTYVFKHKEKLGIIGPNGAGKSTFIRLITEEEKSDSGSVNKGINTIFSVFDQHSKSLEPETRIIDIIKAESEVIMLPNGKSLSAGQMLEKFLFPSKTHHTPVKKLSGGEKRRLHLVLILMQNPNFLILDEPTNDLDIKTLSILEDFLVDFPGCLVVISHDRYFMDRVTEHLLIFDGKGNINEFPGNFSDYLEKQQLDSAENMKKIKAEKNIKEIKKVQVKLTYNEAIEFSTIESDIEDLESEKTSIEAKLNDGGTNYSELSELQNKIDKLDIQIFEKMERWELLSDKDSKSKN